MKEKKTGKRRWLLLGTAIGSILVIAFIVNSIDGMYQSIRSTYHPIENRSKSEKRHVAVSLQEYDPVSFLLLGVDARLDDPGRTDTIMVATVNPEQGSMILFNIPRDTYVEIVGKGIRDKINHAFAFGGVEMAIDTVERFLDIPIDYYAQINMEGFQEVIDTLGGVDVDVPFSFKFGGVQFNEGPMHMDGETAMMFVQMRKQDPEGDLGRNKRQQLVIQAILQESLALKNLNKIDTIMERVGNNLLTSVAPSDYVPLKDIYQKIDTNAIETLQIEGEDQMIDGIYYYLVSEEERRRVSDKLKEHLGLMKVEVEASES